MELISIVLDVLIITTDIVIICYLAKGMKK